MTFWARHDTDIYAFVLLVYQFLHGGGIVGVAPAPGKIDVMIVEESEDRNKLTAGQRNAILSNKGPSDNDKFGSVRYWCSTHCEPNGFLLVDKDSDMSKEPQKFQDAAKQPRTGVPWLYVVHPSTTFSGPLPETVEATRAILQRYGGQ